MKKYFTLLMVMMVGGVMDKAVAQDIHFSQFYDNPILRNPALTGIFSGDYKAGVDYRSQWANISVPYQTVLADFETRIPIGKEVKDFLSLGLVATYDHAGTISFNTVQVYPAINYNKSMEDEHNTFFSAGFTGGYIQRSIDVSKAQFSSQYINGSYSSYNPTGENTSFKNIQSYDLGAGISLNGSLGTYNHANYYIGVSAYHVLQPNQAFLATDDQVRVTPKFDGQFGFKCRLDDQFAITAHFNYTIQYPYQEIIGGGLLSWRNINTLEPHNTFTIYAGAFYRVGDAIIPTFKLDHKNYSVNLSYDVTLSTLHTVNTGAGGFEISLFTRGVFSKERTAADAVKCPHFEVLDQD
ncbi:MAG: PorP/SprF family type IX secretion system membrane protein [Flavipsychrobacter sp.]|nr:PorP/SprF family type IX secretion system membrane protein [Flavipsychrobacter sp.]